MGTNLFIKSVMRQRTVYLTRKEKEEILGHAGVAPEVGRSSVVAENSSVDYGPNLGLRSELDAVKSQESDEIDGGVGLEISRPPPIRSSSRSKALRSTSEQYSAPELSSSNLSPSEFSQSSSVLDLVEGSNRSAESLSLPVTSRSTAITKEPIRSRKDTSSIGELWYHLGRYRSDLIAEENAKDIVAAWSDVPARNDKDQY